MWSLTALYWRPKTKGLAPALRSHGPKLYLRSSAGHVELRFVGMSAQATTKAIMNNPVQLTNEPSSEPGFGSRAARKSVLSAMSVVAALVVCSPLAYGKTIRVPSGSILTIQDGVAAA